MDLEQLMNIDITSVSKKSQSLLKTAAAAHVISQEDIRRSGATSLPEVLRGVPGLQVTQIDANKWAISIRGFNDRFANKLLVMVDGRSIYTPLFSGIFWNMHDMLLEDIERIEIIRGPGGTLWGANAVNGVINIITKKTSDTQGGQIDFVGGSQERNLSARYGGKFNNHTSYRVFAKGKQVDKFNNMPDQQAHDKWRNLTSGFRIDNDLDSNNKWMLQGGYNIGTAGQLATSTSLQPPSTQLVADTLKYQSGNILFRWNKQNSNDSKWRVQAYYDYFKRHSRGASHQIHTFDIEIQNQIRILKNHEVVWGIGYRGVLDELESSFAFTFDPRKNYANTFNAFIQDEFQINNALRLTLGTKLEHNDFSGFEYQPNARLLWEVNDRHSIWSAASRAVRIPSRATYSDVRVNYFVAPGTNPQSPPVLLSILGRKNFNSEKVYAFELGYRGQITDIFTLDAALFYNYYDDLASIQTGFRGLETQPAPPHILIANTVGNNMRASSYGAELLMKWQANHAWLITTSYSWFKLDARLRNSNTANSNGIILTKDIIGNSDPRHQFSVRSNIKLPFKLEFDSNLYFTDRLAARNVSAQARLDLKLAWMPKPKLELSIVAQNIFNKQHQEFTAPDIFNSEIPRSAYGRISIKF